MGSGQQLFVPMDRANLALRKRRLSNRSPGENGSR